MSELTEGKIVWEARQNGYTLRLRKFWNATTMEIEHEGEEVASWDSYSLMGLHQAMLAIVEGNV